MNRRLSVVRFGGAKNYMQISDSVGGPGSLSPSPTPHFPKAYCIYFGEESQDKRSLEIRELNYLPLFPGIKSISPGSQAALDFGRIQF